MSHTILQSYAEMTRGCYSTKADLESGGGGGASKIYIGLYIFLCRSAIGGFRK